MAHSAVIFDLDGTLLDTLEDLGGSMNTVLRNHGFSEHPIGKYKKIIGGGMESFVTNAFPSSGWDRADMQRYIQEVRDEYSRRWNNATAPYPGIEEMLDGLSRRGVRMSILSNKPDDFTGMIVSKLLSKWRFECVSGEREGMPVKPDPASAMEIARRMSLGPAEFVFAGDSGFDMKTARAAGMYPAGVLWGFRDERELRENGAAEVFSKPRELLALFNARA